MIGFTRGEGGGSQMVDIAAVQLLLLKVTIWEDATDSAHEMEMLLRHWSLHV